MLDLAATRPEREVERAWNEMEVLELTDALSVPDLLKRHPRRPGSLVLARLAERKTLLVGRTRNDLEEAFLALIDRNGLPRPRMNAHLAVRDRFFEVDCLWEDRRVAIELDGGAAGPSHDEGLSQGPRTGPDPDRRRLDDDPRHLGAHPRYADRIGPGPALHPHAVPLTDGPGALRPLPPR
jgi:hypothetical protein